SPTALKITAAAYEVCARHARPWWPDPGGRYRNARVLAGATTLGRVSDDAVSTPDVPSAASADEPALVTQIRDGYAFGGPALHFGAAVVEGTAYADAPVQIPLSMMNRHGLVAGATGTGK